MEDLSGHDGQILHRPMILTLTRGVGGLDGINGAMGMVVLVRLEDVGLGKDT